MCKPLNQLAYLFTLRQEVKRKQKRNPKHHQKTIQAPGVSIRSGRTKPTGAVGNFEK